MRYGKDHKENTHRRVVEVASARLRKEGLDGVWVATLMGEAGLTHGGFYSHFASKEALVEEVIEAGMDETFARVTEVSKEGGLEGLIRFYLRPSHREHPERGFVRPRRLGRRSPGVRRRREVPSPASFVGWSLTSSRYCLIRRPRQRRRLSRP